MFVTSIDGVEFHPPVDFELAASSVIWVLPRHMFVSWAHGSPLRSCPPALLRMTSQAGVAVCPGSPCSSPSPLSGYLTLSHFLLHRPLSVGESVGVSALRPALSSLSAVSPRSSRVSLQSNQPSRRLTSLSAPSRGVLSGPSESCSLRSEPSHVVHHHCCCCCCRVGRLGTSTSKDLVSSSSATSTYFFG